MRLSLLLLFLCACTHLPKPIEGTTLFPWGTYKHEVQIHVTNKGLFPARGILQHSQEGIKLYLLGPNDVTIAKISESFKTKSVKIEIVMEDFKKHEHHLDRIYPLVRSFILYPRQNKTWGHLSEKTSSGQGYPQTLTGPQNIEIEILEFKNNHPTKFKITHSEFSVNIEEFI